MSTKAHQKAPTSHYPGKAAIAHWCLKDAHWNCRGVENDPPCQCVCHPLELLGRIVALLESATGRLHWDDEKYEDRGPHLLRDAIEDGRKLLNALPSESDTPESDTLEGSSLS